HGDRSWFGCAARELPPTGGCARRRRAECGPYGGPSHGPHGSAHVRVPATRCGPEGPRQGTRAKTPLCRAVERRAYGPSAGPGARQNCRAQLLSRPVSHHALSLTRSFHVPLAVSEEASTVYVVRMSSALPPVPYDFSVYAEPSGAISWIRRS